MGMYWLHALTYMLVVFLLLLKFILAITVDASSVQRDEELNVTNQDVLSDCIDAFRSRVAFMCHDLPTLQRSLSILSADMDGPSIKL